MWREVHVTYEVDFGGQSIITTAEHPFWVYGKGFTNAEELTVGDEIVCDTSENSDFHIEEITGIVKHLHDEKVTVYNFSVEDWHTYFVGDIGLWVHNAKCKINADTIEFKGKEVTQNNNLFDPNAVDNLGRTNTQRMQQGLSPQGYDGKPVNIHHIDQTNSGPVMEISQTDHQSNYSSLHQNTGQSSSQINRTEFGAWRKDYWNWRSNDFN